MADSAPNAPKPKKPELPKPADAGDDDPMIGSTIGSFRIIRSIGKGGMGSVYLGEQTIIGSKVAIKILHPHLASHPTLVSRFYAEAKAVNLIGHENIVNIFDMNVVPPNRYYLIMEYLEGQMLNHIIRGPVDTAIAIPILMQACDALQAAHTHGVVHRDLKPENIFLIKRGKNEHFVKLLDFGIAKLFATEVVTEATSAGTLVGTPEYMAPEQTTGAKVDGRSDLYSLGVIAYVMATGQLPFKGGGLSGLLIAHQMKIAEAPHQLNPKVPRGFSDVIMKAMAKRPDDRFVNADAFAAALADALKEVPVFAVGGSGPAAASSVFEPSSSSDSEFDARLESLVALVPPKRLTPKAAAAPEGAGAIKSPPSPPPENEELPLVEAKLKIPTRELPVMVTKQAQPEPELPHAAPKPVHPRHEAKFDAVVDGYGALPCQDISKGGMFLCTEQPLPRIFSRIKMKLPVAGDMELLTEVVRHVAKDQAKAWGMSPGFGVQFVDLKPAHKDLLARIVQGLPAEKTAKPEPEFADDAVTTEALTRYQKRINGDHYVVLQVQSDAEFSEVKARGREIKRELEALKARRISKRQLDQIETAERRVQQALDVIGNPSQRLEFDAHRGNFKGVARCVSAGLTVSEIDSVRQKFLTQRGKAESQAHVKFVTGNAYDSSGQSMQALEHYEAALELDPLNLKIQQKYWAIKRRVSENRA